MLQTRISFVLFSLLFVALFGASQARTWKSITTGIPAASNDVENDLESDYDDYYDEDPFDEDSTEWITMVVALSVGVPTVVFIVVLILICLRRRRIRQRRLALLSCQNQSYDSYPAAVMTSAYQVPPQYAAQPQQNAPYVPNQQYPITKGDSSQLPQEPPPAYY